MIGGDNGVFWLSKHYMLSYKNPVHPDEYGVIRTLFDDLIEELDWKFNKKRFVKKQSSWPK